MRAESYSQLPFITATLLLFLLSLPCAAQQTKVKVKPRTTATDGKRKGSTTKKRTAYTKKKVYDPTDAYVISTSQCVDLGLSVKWASYNLGASSPEQAGDYYAWGETSAKTTSYDPIFYKYYDGNYTFLGDSISGNASYDAARAQWGAPWRMPTKGEFAELVKLCTWKWTTYGGIKGYKVIGPNGNAIFLPAAGYRYLFSVHESGKKGGYWSGTITRTYHNNGSAEPSWENAYQLRFMNTSYSTDYYVTGDIRHNGWPIRPVCD